MINVLFLGDTKLFPFHEYKNLNVMETLSNQKEVYDVLLVHFDQNNYSKILQDAVNVNLNNFNMK